MSKNNKRMITMFIMIFIVLTLCIIMLSRHDPESVSFNSEEISFLNDNWLFTAPDSSSYTVSLPTELPVKNDWTIISNILPEDFRNGDYICLRTSQHRIRAFIDGVPVYSFEAKGYPKYLHLIGGFFHIFRLPDSSSGKTLRIETFSPVEADSGRCSDVMYGSKAALLFYLLEQYGPALLVSILILICGIAILIMFLILRRRTFIDHSLLYLSFIAILASGWLLGESKLLQLLVGNPIVNVLTVFLSLMLLPMAVILFLNEICTTKTHIGYHILFWIDVAIIAVSVILQFADVCTFLDMLIFTHLTYGAIILYSIYAFHKEAKEGNPQLKQYLLPICFLFLFTAFEVVHFYINASQPSIYIHIGLFIFIFLLGCVGAKKAYKSLKTAEEAKYYEQLAYIDLMTGKKNRTAYEQALLVLSKNDEVLEHFCTAVFDINCLKLINDSYGHAMGDKLLRVVSDCIQEAFEGTGVLYRTGGDEFVCMCEGKTTERVNTCIKVMERLIQEQNNDLYQYGVSYGVACYNPSLDHNVKDIIMRADKIMYEYKRNTRHRED